MATKKIALLGGPSAGKSTLAARTYAELKEMGQLAELVQEYAREHINKMGIADVLTQYLIYKKQREKEDIIPDKIDFIITDSPTILSYVYALRFSKIGNKDHQLMLIDMYSEMLLNGFSRYDHIYYLEPNRPYRYDGTRTQTPEESKEIGELTKILLDTHHVKYSIISEPDTTFRMNVILKDLKLI